MADSMGKLDKAWKEILAQYPIEENTRQGGVYEIQANEIKAFREPRLMTKFDTSESVANPLKELGLNVLPVSRHSYVLGKFNLYEKFPDVTKLKPTPITLPDYETLRLENITSESNAINALLATHTLENFLNEEEQGLLETFNGRMGTGDFSFDVDLLDGTTKKTINVSKAQLEIDGGFESQQSVCIMEAKNIRHDDFNVRQLYFPYRKYLAIVQKPIRLVFSQYTNLTYYLYEYEFTEPTSFSSIKLRNKQAYTFEDCQISEKDIVDVWKNTPVITDDNQDKQVDKKIPFIQADRLDRVISLAECLSSAEDNTLTTEQLTEHMGLVTRQAAYYPAAGEYLGLFQRSRNATSLTNTARKILNMHYRERQLAYTRLILQHQIFHDLFGIVVNSGVFPDKAYVEKEMLRLNVCNEGSTVHRRATSVLAWLSWIFALVDDEI
ncbi:type II restriction enzyme [Aeriscardovia aeriphila]|uniref:Type II restriction endonuclease n=1 Tax=Aeriscardovia aeriphila TaxID=218139 RepID=A0A261FBK9_9BIFI|nr:hypothetical protein [Aeriscardovia aeriphila]NYI25334.1 hypothetical protein [Aeriscardovia aeriphila]OZG56512.1 hypothetical protein AEAE_1000 [Aeriscardovia aeriphila]